MHWSAFMLLCPSWRWYSFIFQTIVTVFPSPIPTSLTLFLLLLVGLGYSRYVMINYHSDTEALRLTLPQMTLTQLAFVLSTLTVFVVYWMSGQRRQGRNLPPGPRKYPLIGSLLSMPRTLEWETFAKWGKEYSPWSIETLILRSVFIQRFMQIRILSMSTL